MAFYASHVVHATQTQETGWKGFDTVHFVRVSQGRSSRVEMLNVVGTLKP